MNKKLKIAILIFFIIMLLCILSIICLNNNGSELKTIKSAKELSKIYYSEDNSTVKDVLLNIVTMPFSIITGNWDYYDYPMGITNSSTKFESTLDSSSIASPDTLLGSSTSSGSSKKDYSTTNIQVENVDEADITKTDGDYIYSLSSNNVIITNVVNPSDIKIESTIPLSSIPEDLILYKNKLIVISSNANSSSSYYSNSQSNTIVSIYDIAQKSTPQLLKNYELYEPYYTSRCINNKLYVISSGYLREDDDDKIITYYTEDHSNREIGFENIKYLKDVKTTKQTLISFVDLDNPKEDVRVNSYLMDISNAYVSENSIYLLDQKYDRFGGNGIPIHCLFGLKGIFGLADYVNDDNSKIGYYTEIYKFNITEDGHVTYNTKAKIKGKTINQYSLDELNNHLRIALYDNDGARVAIFDENLNQIGISNYVAKNEKMYSSRFIGNKAYLVTYRNMDPLFVIDLSNEAKPKVLGELKIPGYSTYLHPYDENHLIGIGMETEEVINRNSSGKVISTSSKIIGMKMALFDVSNVNNPRQISSTVIGDRRTTSAILTNPKALLFSKEKELIAIPVNNYSEDFEIDNSKNTYSSTVDSYTNYKKDYISEGYLVYNINIKDGFKLKGTITHEKEYKNSTLSYYNYRYNTSKLLRGLYIEDNLYTISETAVKVNNLDTLELVDELKIKGGF